MKPDEIQLTTAVLPFFLCTDRTVLISKIEHPSGTTESKAGLLFRTMNDMEIERNGSKEVKKEAAYHTLRKI
jgi:hypothetical protein